MCDAQDRQLIFGRANDDTPISGAEAKAAPPSMAQRLGAIRVWPVLQALRDLADAVAYRDRQRLEIALRVGRKPQLHKPRTVRLVVKLVNHTCSDSKLDALGASCCVLADSAQFFLPALLNS